jgi:hypothetical protein
VEELAFGLGISLLACICLFYFQLSKMQRRIRQLNIVKLSQSDQLRSLREQSDKSKIKIASLELEIDVLKEKKNAEQDFQLSDMIYDVKKYGYTFVRIDPAHVLLRK